MSITLKIYVNFMLIYVNIEEKNKNNFFRQTDGRTDRQTHQKYSSEPHKMESEQDFPC